MKLVTLKTQPERDREALAPLIQRVVDEQAQGRVKSVLWAYFDTDGDFFSAVSDSMTLQELSFAIHVLQERLNRLLGAEDA